MLVRAGAILGLVMLETRPPRCRECGVLGGESSDPRRRACSLSPTGALAAVI